MRICIPICAKTIEKAKEQLKKAAKYADFIELWLDYFGKKCSTSDLKTLIKTCKKPVIAVCKSKIEKGLFKGSEAERIAVLEKAVSAGAKLVDIGIHTEQKLIRSLKKVSRKFRGKVIISKHFWNTMPPLTALKKTFYSAKKRGADIIKIAAKVKNWSDNTVLFEFTSQMASRGEKVIIIGMGKEGKISRIACPLLGSYLTYVALDEKSKTAEGQITLTHASPNRYCRSPQCWQINAL